MRKILFLSFLFSLFLCPLINSQEVAPESLEPTPENIDPAPIPENQDSQAPEQKTPEIIIPKEEQKKPETEEIKTPEGNNDNKIPENTEKTEEIQKSQENSLNLEELPEVTYQEKPKLEIEVEPEKPDTNPHRPGPSDEFIMEWEKVMGDFIPEDITTFKIESKSQEYFMQEAEVGGTASEVMIKGAFFIHDDNVEDFRLEVTNPVGSPTLSIMNKKEGIFSLNCTMSGTYTFKFINPSSNDIKMTVAAHYFHEEKAVVKNQEIDVLHEKLKNSVKMLKSIISESKFGDTHRSAHLDVLAKGYKRLFYFTFLESAVILMVTLLQIHYIEKLLSHKVSV